MYKRQVPDQLLELDCDECLISGSLDVIDWASFTSLNYLRLSDAGITGTIPAEIGELSDLLELSLSRNQLMGTIPGAVGNMQSLEEIFLDENLLTGTIPRSLLLAPSLQRVALDGNYLEDDLTEEFCPLQFDLFLVGCGKNMTSQQVLCDCCTTC